MYYRAAAGTAKARLFDETTSTGVADSTMSTTSSSFVRARTGALTLTDGDEYRAQFGTVSPDGGVAIGAKLVIL